MCGGAFQCSCSLAMVGGFRSLFDLLTSLGQEFFGAAGVATQIVAVVLLGFVHFLPGLLDKFLGCTHVSVSFADVNAWLLREDYGAQREGCAEG